jgi:hypothetical protein
LKTCSYRVIENCSDYFNRPEVSNSDLSSLEAELSAKDPVGGDKVAAYRFGSLLDAIITEPDRVDFLKKTLDEIPVEPSEWNKALKMRKAFFGDEFCNNLLKMSLPQVVMVSDVVLNVDGFVFTITMRCKWDFFTDFLGADLKSTVATTQEQFEAVCIMFQYDRQMAVYMEISGIDQVVLIGVSKVNNKVFKKFIKRGDPFHQSGMEKFKVLALKHYMLFG